MSPAVRPPGHRRASGDDDGRHAVRGHPRRRPRHHRRADRLGGSGARTAARRLRASVAARSRRLGDAGPHRLPHASRLRRQSRERVRGASWRRHVRGNRAGGRRNQGDGRGDASGMRRRTGRGEPAATLGAGGRGRDDGRDQVGLRSRHGERMPAAPCGAARRGRRWRGRADDAARGARAARGILRPCRRLHRSRLPRDDTRRRRRRDSRMRSTHSARRSASRRRRRGEYSRLRVPTGCR